LEGAELDQEMVRFLNKSEWDKLVQKFFEEEKKSSEGLVRNVWATLVRYRDLIIPLNIFANHIFSYSSLPARDREILILRIAWLCYSEYAWGQHVQFVKQSKLLSDDEIHRIMEGSDAQGWDFFDATLIRSVDELYTDAFISDKTWNALEERYNTNQLMDLILTVGQYHMVSMTCNTLGVQLDEGIKGFSQ